MPGMCQDYGVARCQTCQVEASPNVNETFSCQQRTSIKIQARIAQLVANWLGTEEVPGLNLGKGDNYYFSIKRKCRCSTHKLPTEGHHEHVRAETKSTPY